MFNMHGNSNGPRRKMHLNLIYRGLSYDINYAYVTTGKYRSSGNARQSPDELAALKTVRAPLIEKSARMVKYLLSLSAIFISTRHLSLR